MELPRFRMQDRLSAWLNCTLHPVCSCERGTSVYPVRVLMQLHGDHTFEDVLRRLVCSKCKQRPAPVYLVAGHHRTYCYGGLPDWSLELVPPPGAR